MHAHDKLIALLRGGRRYELAKGQIVQSSDYREVVSLVDAGYVKRYMIGNDGSHSVQAVYGPGDVFPLTLIYKDLLDQDLYEGPETHHYETMTKTTLYTIQSSELVKAVEDDPSLYRGLFVLAGQRLRSNIQRLENISLTRAQNRVAHQLVFFGVEFGKKTPKGIKIDLPLTHQDLAGVLSTARETVSLALQQLREKKLIIPGKNIIIPDIEKLQEEAHS